MKTHFSIHSSLTVSKSLQRLHRDPLFTLSHSLCVSADPAAIGLSFCHKGSRKRSVWLQFPDLVKREIQEDAGRIEVLFSRYSHACVFDCCVPKNQLIHSLRALKDRLVYYWEQGVSSQFYPDGRKGSPNDRKRCGQREPDMSHNGVNKRQKVVTGREFSRFFSIH